MTIKQVAIIVDDFTSNSVANYSNVTYYDYGTFNILREWDYYLNSNFTIDGYGDVDYWEFIFVDSVGGFYQVNYDSPNEWNNGFDKDYKGSGTGIGLGGFTAFFDDYYFFSARDSSLNLSIQHGDWVLYAFQEQLINPENVEIILIDVDSTDLNFQFNKLFSPIPSIYNNGMPTLYIEHILLDWLNTNSSTDNIIYIPTVFSASISGALPSLGETLSLAYLANNNVAIVQAAPNVNNGFFDWGSLYSNVINVGAWNVDANAQALFSSLTTLFTIDILADGKIYHPEWNINFGTSFATPRVSAEIVNVYAEVFRLFEESINSGELTNEDLNSAPHLSYSDIIETLIEWISSRVYINVNGNWIIEPTRVLTSDIQESVYPNVIQSVNGLSGLYILDATLGNNDATGILSINGTAAEGGSLTASLTDASDADGPITLSYQWQELISETWIDIAGHNSNSATLVIPDDQTFVGKQVRAVVTSTDIFGGTTKFTGSAQTIINVNDAPTGSVMITGTAKQGETLTASNTLSDPDGIPGSGSGAIAYQWLANGEVIAGANASTFTLTQAQVGKAISVRASYTDNGGTAESVTSAATDAVANVNDAPTGSVTITGTAKQGETLTVSNTLSDPDGIPGSGHGAIAYQWLADGAPIVGATEASFLVTLSQVGKAVSVRAKYTDQQGTLETVTSSSTSLVADLGHVTAAIEQAVPSLPTAEGISVPGDGNGDGVPDDQQTKVASGLLEKLDGSGDFAYATLVADSAEGKADAEANVEITSFAQRPVPDDIPAQIQMPLGLIAFTAAVQTVGKTEQFSLYVDTALGVNGYWKQNAQGTWVNLASEPWGGSTTVEGTKTRLDFQITDGGLFDGDGVANGVIVDPGAAALMPLSLQSYAPVVPVDAYWF